jgi:hypothetical protein
MLKLIYVVTAFVLSAFLSLLYGQSTENEKIEIKGAVAKKKEIVSNAIVYLMDASDKKLIKTESADQTGNFVFQNVPAGNYFIRISENEKIKYVGNPFEAKQDINLGTITFQAEIQNLDEVVVTKAKPYIERKEGKMILNVESSIGATGSSAFEVLEKAPGVNVDNNDNISLRGKGGIIIQIDGKPTPMSGTNLANYLRGIPSGIIDKIEFITNPDSKYDASGSAIINIRMKKDKKIGLNGSVTTAYGQGRYPKSNNGMSLNYRDKKVNVFGSYNFAYREGFNELLLKREFYENSVFIGAYDQDNWLKMDFRNHIGRAGVDFYANKKHAFGIVANTVSNKFNPIGKNVSDVYDASNTTVSRFQTKNNSYDNWHNHSVNLNHRFTIDTVGTELTSDFDYANYGNQTDQNFVTRYFDLNGSEFRAPYLLHGNIVGDLKIYAAKSDFVTTLKNKLKIETGIKSSYVKADNNLKFFDEGSGTPVMDTLKSNHFIYTENINSAYVNISKEFSKKWSGYFGLRVENTNVTGKQLVDDTSFKNTYTQLFPSAFMSYAFNGNNSLEFNYSRRISRPSYDQLNPFKFFLDPTTYKEGNPYLLPQTTHSFEVTHVYKQKVFTTLNFSRTTDNITEVIAPSEDDQKLTVQTNKNLSTADIYGVFMIVPVNVNKWWSMSNSFNFYYGSYSGTVANTTLENQGNFTYNCNSVSNFKLGGGYAAEFTGNYRAREVYAFMDVDPIWFVNLGFQKKFKNSTLKLALNDIFYTNKTTADTEFTNYKENFKVRRDVRTAVVSYTYNFGNNSNSPRRRAGGADDIKQRAGAANG